MNICMYQSHVVGLWDCGTLSPSSDPCTCEGNGQRPWIPTITQNGFWTYYLGTSHLLRRVYWTNSELCPSPNKIPAAHMVAAVEHVPFCVQVEVADLAWTKVIWVISKARLHEILLTPGYSHAGLASSSSDKPQHRINYICSRTIYSVFAEHITNSRSS